MTTPIRFQYSLTTLFACITFCSAGALLVRYFGLRGLGMFMGASAASMAAIVAASMMRRPKLVGITAIAGGGLGSLFGETLVEMKVLNQPSVLLIGMGLGAGLWVISSQARSGDEFIDTHAPRTAFILLAVCIATSAFAYWVSALMGVGERSEALAYIVVGLTAGSALAGPYLVIWIVSKLQNRTKPSSKR